MQKLVYALWRDPRMDSATFCRRVREEVGAGLVELGAHGVQVNVADADAQGAAPALASCRPQMEAFICVWLDSANSAWRKPFDKKVASLGGRVASYVVGESRPMQNTRFPVAIGERTPGFVQIALFRRPPQLDYRAWLEIWLESHTQLAIDTQDTFLYVQNIVARPLGFDTPAYDAIVEEGFPPAAFGNTDAFFDAAGDPEKSARNQQLMSESCVRFIDFCTIDVVQTSQYVLKSPA